MTDVQHETTAATRPIVHDRSTKQSRWAWTLLGAALPIGLLTWVLTLVVFYGFVHQGEGMGSDTERLVMNMILFTSVLVPTFLGAVFGGLAWRTSRRTSPGVAAVLNALVAALMLGMIIGYTGTPVFTAVAMGIGLVLMLAVLVVVARPWQHSSPSAPA